MSYTPFAGAIGILTKDKDTHLALKYLPEERPVVFQICDNDEERLLDAARQILRLKPDIIDINMGCSIRGISSRGAGAGLLQDVRKVGKIVKSFTSVLDIRVSAKIRLGWSHRSKNYLDIARAIDKGLKPQENLVDNRRPEEASQEEPPAKYTIQVASFKTEKSARREADKLQQQGVSTSLLNKGNYVCVCVGRFNEKQAAVVSLKELKETYQDCFIRRL